MGFCTLHGNQAAPLVTTDQGAQAVHRARRPYISDRQRERVPSFRFQIPRRHISDTWNLEPETWNLSECQSYKPHLSVRLANGLEVTQQQRSATAKFGMQQTVVGLAGRAD